MPKLYEYLGMSIFFYSNEHEPAYVHVRDQGRESKFEILIENGEIKGIRSKTIRGLRACPQIKDWLFFPSCRSFLRGQMTTRGEGRSVKKKDLGNFGCLLGIGATPDSH